MDRHSEGTERREACCGGAGCALQWDREVYSVAGWEEERTKQAGGERRRMYKTGKGSAKVETGMNENPSAGQDQK